jgi:hypothetical protein
MRSTEQGYYRIVERGAAKATGQITSLQDWFAKCLLIRPDPHFTKTLDRLAGFEVLKLEQLAHLDLAFLAIAGGVGIPLRPFDSLFL